MFRSVEFQAAFSGPRLLRPSPRDLAARPRILREILALEQALGGDYPGDATRRLSAAREECVGKSAPSSLHFTSTFCCGAR